MIIKHTIQGSLDTTLHDFEIHTESMDLFVLGTHYTNRNQKLIEHEKDIPIQISIEKTTKDTWYEIWLTTDGVTVLSRAPKESFEDIENPIDRLAWFKVPANTTTLDDIEINTVVMNP